MMSAPVVEARIRIAASPDDVYAALTDEAALEAWFAEKAAVDLAKRRYVFSGRFTVGTPVADTFGENVYTVEAGRRLVYSWPLDGEETVVAMALAEYRGGTSLDLEHHNLTGTMPWLVEAFWSMALENLRAYVERGESGLRFDFANIPYGDVRCSTEISADPDEVFDALINPAQLDRYMAHPPARIEPAVGGAYDLGWSSEGPVKILDLAPGERLSYSWTSEKDDAVGTVVTWEVEGSAGRTHLTLVHTGFAADRAGIDYGLGWLDYLNRIKQMVEAGDPWEKPHVRVRERQASDIYIPSAGIAASVEVAADQ